MRPGKITTAILIIFCHVANCAGRPDHYELGVTTEITVRTKVSMLSIKFDARQVTQPPNLEETPTDPAEISFQAFDVTKGDVREITSSFSLRSFEEILKGGRKEIRNFILTAAADQDGGLLLSVNSPENGLISIHLIKEEVDKLKKWIVFCKGT
jgi:hypothetical protein